MVRSSWATQNSGPTGTIDVEEARHAVGALVQRGTGNLIGSKSGFRPRSGGGNDDPGIVYATGTPDAFVHVASFQLFLQGGRSSQSGVYICTLEADANINILSTPADPTNPRNDLIVAQQSDTFYGDGNSDLVIRQVVGTPSGSPVDPSVSGSSDYVALGRVRVNANATTITSGNITDLRTSGHAKSLVGGLYSVALGAILPVKSSAERDALTGLYDGIMVWRIDTRDIEVYTNAAWTTAAGRAPWITTFSPTLTNMTLGNGTSVFHYRLNGKTCDFWWKFVFGTTSTMSTDPHFSLPVTPAANVAVSGGILPFQGHIFNGSGPNRRQLAFFYDASAARMNFWNATPTTAQITSAAPAVWAVNDEIYVWGTYETA